MYKGVLIEQSILDPQTVLKHMRVVGTRVTKLESESFRGEVKFLNVEVAEDQLWEVLSSVAQGIQGPGWYFHLVGKGRLYIVMPHVVFFADGSEDEALTHIVTYAINQCGIHRDQLDLKKLWSDPYA